MELYGFLDRAKQLKPIVVCLVTVVSDDNIFSAVTVSTSHWDDTNIATGKSIVTVLTKTNSEDIVCIYLSLSAKMNFAESERSQSEMVDRSV